MVRWPVLLTSPVCLLSSSSKCRGWKVPWSDERLKSFPLIIGSSPLPDPYVGIQPLVISGLVRSASPKNLPQTAPIALHGARHGRWYSRALLAGLQLLPTTYFEQYGTRLATASFLPTTWA